MIEPTAATPDVGPEAPAPPAAEGEERAPETPLVEDDLLVEDVSIDGMCGVH